VVLVIWAGCSFLFLGLLGLPASAKTLFEDDFDSGKLDKYILSGAMSKNVKVKASNPPEHGPNVLLMPALPHVDNVLALVKSLVFKDGIIQVLWADVELPEDTDGPFFFRGQIGKGDPNDPKLDPKAIFDNSYLVELDTDTGLHVAIITAGAENIPNQFKAAPQSTGGWTWIKTQVEGPKIKVKSWLAKEKEPAKWDIEAEDKTWESGMVGLRAWSGSAEIAYFVVADLAGPTPQAVDPKGKLATTWSKLKSFH
jgi:hypothetical protein